MKRILFLTAMLLLGTPAASSWAGSQSGVVTLEFDLSHHKSSEEVRLWIPYPVSDSDQLVRDVKISGDYASSAVYTEPVHANPILFAGWSKEAKCRKLTLSFAVERKEVRRSDSSGSESSWDPVDYAHYLGSTNLGPIDGEVKRLADEITRDQKTVTAKAKAIYDWICENMHRDPNVRGCGKGDVCTLLSTRGGKCTDISSVFVALARASGVPSREVFGIRLGKKPEEEITTYQHCWAEFYAPGHGWVAVDPADVLKAMLVEKLKPEDEKAGEYKTYYWGGIDPYRIKLSLGRDIILNPPQSGEPLNTFGYPFAQVGEHTIDWLDPSNFKYSITYKAN